jgi:hypothetical protein
VYANKGSCLIAAVQSFYPTEVKVHTLSELMNVRPEVDVPTLTSFWLDLPQRSWPNRTSFIAHISKIVKQCRRFTVPFCIITHNRPTVDNCDESQVPAWKEFIVSNNVSWTTQCSCQYQCGQFQSLHFKVKVYAFNTASILDSSQCNEVAIPVGNRQTMSTGYLLFYRKIVGHLLYTNEAVRQRHPRSLTCVAQAVECSQQYEELHIATTTASTRNSSKDVNIIDLSMDTLGVAQRLPDLSLNITPVTTSDSPRGQKEGVTNITYTYLLFMFQILNRQ